MGVSRATLYRHLADDS
ncbi:MULTISPECIES: hypothetical protein [Streptomyces violaceoruber group]|uniref:Uncharacterized protein n=1 Tax=Streptomyces rubrogriseus TaxID=194673 RepID=A0ABT4NXF7_9ACTN|nr:MULTISPECIES: hypothetical protein [Streptomyces anthocyanicus group]MCW8119604.1 hypothetical protein [Streptomyces anthocyanicus]MCZ4633817.1 hypothetical protein [Streptomyces rubrogriseus]